MFTTQNARKLSCRLLNTLDGPKNHPPKNHWMAPNQELADNVLGEGSEASLTEMSDSELLKFVALDVSRATLDE